MAGERSQRWRERRAAFRPAEDVPFDAGSHGWAPVGDSVARAFVGLHHYSGSYPASVCAVGMFRTARNRKDELCGVAVFSVPMQPKAADAYGAAGTRFCELGRLCLLDDVPCNGETWFLKRAMATLSRLKTDPAGRPLHGLVLAYSDPVPRVATDGRVVLAGHVGAVYGRAGPALYLGRGTPRTLRLAPDATVVSERALSKLRNGERGAAYAYADLLRHGAPPIAEGEDAAAYVKRALLEGPFRRLRHPGNHVYAFPLGDRAARSATGALLRRSPAPPQPEALDRT